MSKIPAAGAKWEIFYKWNDLAAISGGSEMSVVRLTMRHDEAG